MLFLAWIPRPTLPLLFVWIVDFVEAAVTDEATVWQSQIRAVFLYGLLDLDDLRDMIWTRLELVLADPLVDPHQHLVVDIMPVVDPPEVLHKVLELHPLVGL